MDNSEHQSQRYDKVHDQKNSAHFKSLPNATSLPDTQSFSDSDLFKNPAQNDSDTHQHEREEDQTDQRNEYESTTNQVDETESAQSNGKPAVPLEDAGTVVSIDPLLEIESPQVEKDTDSTKIGTGRGKSADLTSHNVDESSANIPIVPGMVLGHYKITKFIGGGGMGRVYLGIDQSLDRKVAIKVLHRQRAQDVSSVARFMNEAKSAARLNHEHIAQVYFAGQEGDIPFIAFEFVEGTNIRTIVETQGVFTLPQAIMFLIQIAHALAHASTHGVIHRDVKPSNILITHEGRAKLIDMGLARLLKPTDPRDDLTASGVTLGTFDYISPEQARDPRNADIRSDIYSLGCTFFFMLAGRPPFHEGTVLQKLLQHQGDEPPDIRDIIPGIPMEVALLLQKMMKKDPRQRFQTPKALLAELTAVAGMIGLRPSGPGNAVWTMREAPKRPVLLSHLPWMAGVLLFGISMFLLNWAWKDHNLPIPSVGPNITVLDNTKPAIPAPSQEGTAIPSVPENEKPIPKSLIYGFWTLRSSPKGQQEDPPEYQVSESAQLPDWTSNTSSEDYSGKDDNDPVFRQRLSGQNSTVKVRQAAAFGVPLMNGSINNRKSWNDTRMVASLSLPYTKKSAMSVENSSATSPTLLFVDPTQPNSEERIYANLSTAIAAAGKNATIELRFDGSANLKIEPISLIGKQLTIQAGAGYSPILHFQPTDSSMIKSGRVFLFLVNGGCVRFHKIAFDVDVSPPLYVTKLSLFDLLGDAQVTFSECTVTIRNTMSPRQLTPFLNGVTVFQIADSSDPDLSANSTNYSRRDRIDAAEGASTNLLDTPLRGETGMNSNASHRSGTSHFSTFASTDSPSESSTTPTSYPLTPPTFQENQEELFENRITLDNCVLRGETKILTVEANRSIRLKANNVFFATSFQFLHDRAVAPREDQEKKKILLSLEHVTLFCRSKLSRFEKNETFDPIPVLWSMKNSVVRLNETPIGEFVGFSHREEIDDISQWSGETVFFQNVSCFAELKGSTTDSAYPVVVSCDDWKNLWTPSPPSVNVEVIPANLDSKVAHQITPSELTIPPWPSNPAYQAVSKSETDPQSKINAGQISELLPRTTNGSGRF